MTYSEEDMKRAVDAARKLIEEAGSSPLGSPENVLRLHLLPRDKFYEAVCYWAHVNRDVLP